MISHPLSPFQGQRYPFPVELVDIYPTILDLLQLPPQQQVCRQGQASTTGDGIGSLGQARSRMGSSSRGRGIVTRSGGSGAVSSRGMGTGGTRSLSASTSRGQRSAQKQSLWRLRTSSSTISTSTSTSTGRGRAKLSCPQLDGKSLAPVVLGSTLYEAFVKDRAVQQQGRMEGSHIAPRNDMLSWLTGRMQQQLSRVDLGLSHSLQQLGLLPINSSLLSSTNAAGSSGLAQGNERQSGMPDGMPVLGRDFALSQVIRCARRGALPSMRLRDYYRNASTAPVASAVSAVSTADAGTSSAEARSRSLSKDESLQLRGSQKQQGKQPNARAESIASMFILSDAVGGNVQKVINRLSRVAVWDDCGPAPDLTHGARKPKAGPAVLKVEDEGKDNDGDDEEEVVALLGYSMRTLEYRYTAYFLYNRERRRPLLDAEPYEEELFDHKNETAMDFTRREIHNLAYRSIYSGVVQRLRAKLLAFIRPQWERRG